MSEGDFRSNEKSSVMPADDSLRIELVRDDGTTTVLSESLPVLAGEVVDGSFMSAAKLDEFLKQQIERAKDEDLLFSRAPQGHDDEGLRPDHLRPRGEAFFPKVFKDYGDTLSLHRHQRQRRPRQPAQVGAEPAGGRARRHRAGGA